MSNSNSQIVHGHEVIMAFGKNSIELERGYCWRDSNVVMYI